MKKNLRKIALHRVNAMIEIKDKVIRDVGARIVEIHETEVT